MRMLKSLPSSSLQSLGIQLQMDIPAQATHLPVGGRLMHFVTNWQKITKDPRVLEAIEGYKIEFHSEPAQGKPPGPVCLDQEQTQAMTQEIQELQKKGAISQVDNSLKGFVSQIFLVPKPDSAWRPVINLKSLNRYVIPHHFKMESIRTIKGVLQKDDWLIKLDLKDAYLTIPIAQTQRPLLRFSWHKEMWEFKVLPFGLSSAPWVFTKVTKPISSVLRKLGIRLILYLDDMLIMSQSQIEASSNLAMVMTLLVGLGFIINLKKSVLSPNSTTGFPGLHARFPEDDNFTPTRQDACDKEAGKPYPKQREDYYTRTCSPSGNNGGGSSSNSPSPTLLQTLGSCQDQDNPDGRDILRRDSSTLSQDGRRTDVVGFLSTAVQWSPPTGREMGSDDLLGRLQDGLGCILQWPKHWEDHGPQKNQLSTSTTWNSKQPSLP